MVTPEDTIICELSDNEVRECLETALLLVDHIEDRSDLHKRSYLEKYVDIVLGEIGETTVIKWLSENGKFARSAVDKKSGHPDMGHDVWLRSSDGKIITCSVKSSLSYSKAHMSDILNTFKLASKKDEIRQVNIQVYFWLDIHATPRTTTPSSNKIAIIGWEGSKVLNQISEERYATERRTSVDITLKRLRPMKQLLDFIS